MTTANKQSMVTGVFRSRYDAQRAHEWLMNRGYTSQEINVLMSDSTRTAYLADEKSGRQDASSMAVAGVATGGAVGTAVGATLGAIAAMGMNIVLPGTGLIVAGPIVAALAGGGAGAVAGGLIGGLVGLGIPESNAKAYEVALKEGGVVIGVVPHSKEDAEDIVQEFTDRKAENIVRVS
jgi:hypothetical protein